MMIVMNIITLIQGGPAILASDPSIPRPTNRMATDSIEKLREVLECAIRCGVHIGPIRIQLLDSYIDHRGNHSSSSNSIAHNNNNNRDNDCNIDGNIDDNNYIVDHKNKNDIAKIENELSEFSMLVTGNNSNDNSIDLSIISKQNCDLTILLFDNSGRNTGKLFSGNLNEGINKLNLNTGNLSSGIYWLAGICDGKTAYRKYQVVR